VRRRGRAGLRARAAAEKLRHGSAGRRPGRCRPAFRRWRAPCAGESRRGHFVDKQSARTHRSRAPRVQLRVGPRPCHVRRGPFGSAGARIGRSYEQCWPRQYPCSETREVVRADKRRRKKPESSLNDAAKQEFVVGGHLLSTPTLSCSNVGTVAASACACFAGVQVHPCPTNARRVEARLVSSS